MENIPPGSLKKGIAGMKFRGIFSPAKGKIS